MSWLIVVTGRPAAGKSTLATWLGQQLAFPVISKDEIKEVLFNQLGWQDREWSKALGRASVELMYFFAQTQLEIGQSAILDNAFHPDLASAKLQALSRLHGVCTLQIICDADGRVLFERFKCRAESGIRHEGHVDAQSLDEFETRLKQETSLKLDIEGQALRVDTTDWATVCYEDILNEILAIVVSVSDRQMGC
jgi:predicted kinase